ncbi:MAG: hypothetical protein K0U59_01205 [Gammaproteobacteria bacterium]|nr:hypothetical protein [Gammaproteobacteria bacterium]
MRRIIFTAVALTLSSGVLADAQVEKLVDRVVKGYGGKIFLQLDKVNFRDKHLRFVTGQSYSSKAIDANHYNADLVVDFEKHAKDLKFVGGQKENIYIQHRLFDGKNSYMINHNDKSYSEDKDLDYSRIDRDIGYRLDLLLARQLHEQPEKATYLGKASYYGKDMDRVEFQPEGFPKMKLIINDNGHIVNMQRSHWRTEEGFSFHYSEHKKVNGVTFAEQLYVTNGGKPDSASMKRTLIVKQGKWPDFAVPKSYGREVPSESYNEMTIQKLAEGIYHVGKGWGFTLFVDAGDHYWGIGGYQEIKDRLAEVYKTTGNNKPLKYQIVTHHHLDHLGGMQEVFDLGATFVTVAENMKAIDGIVEQDIPDNRFMIVKDETELAGGLIKVFDFSNDHSGHNLVTLVPHANIFVGEDMYLSRKATGSPKGWKSLNKLAKRIEDQGVTVKYFVAAHSARILTDKDFEFSLNNHGAETKCPEDWYICQYK